jgi:uncharacterized membrane protein YidH (DUF202 family)
VFDKATAMSSTEPSGWAGHDPGVLDSLANERNGLAWQRTALSWFGSGAAVARYFSSDGLLTARATIGWLMMAAGAAIWFAGVQQYHAQDSRLRADLPTSMPVRRIALISFVTSSVIATVIVVEIALW